MVMETGLCLGRRLDGVVGKVPASRGGGPGIERRCRRSSRTRDLQGGVQVTRVVGDGRLVFVGEGGGGGGALDGGVGRMRGLKPAVVDRVAPETYRMGPTWRVLMLMGDWSLLGD